MTAWESWDVIARRFKSPGDETGNNNVMVRGLKGSVYSYVRLCTRTGGNTKTLTNYSTL